MRYAAAFRSMRYKNHYTRYGFMDCLVPYTTTKNKSSSYVEYQILPNWRKCVIFFSPFCLAIGEWRSVSVNPDVIVFVVVTAVLVSRVSPMCHQPSVRRRLNGKAVTRWHRRRQSYQFLIRSISLPMSPQPNTPRTCWYLHLGLQVGRRPSVHLGRACSLFATDFMKW